MPRIGGTKNHGLIYQGNVWANTGEYSAGAETPADRLYRADNDALVRQVVPFAGPPVRHLLYHIAPFGGNGVWQWNVAELLKRFNVFNGRRIVAIVTGDDLDPPFAVKAAFAGHEVTFLECPNDSDLWEVATFAAMWEALGPTGPDDMTFYAHAKGVTRGGDAIVEEWTRIMYHTLLDYLPLVEKMLEREGIAGSFKRFGRFWEDHCLVRWHYCGTFYWVRNARLPRPGCWHEVHRFWAGTEAWPPVIFPTGGCVFHEGGPEMAMYDARYMMRVVLPALTVWEQRHAGLETRRVSEGRPR